MPRLLSATLAMITLYLSLQVQAGVITWPNIGFESGNLTSYSPYGNGESVISQYAGPSGAIGPMTGNYMGLLQPPATDDDFPTQSAGISFQFTGKPGDVLQIYFQFLAAGTDEDQLWWSYQAAGINRSILLASVSHPSPAGWNMFEFTLPDDQGGGTSRFSRPIGFSTLDQDIVRIGTLELLNVGPGQSTVLLDGMETGTKNIPEPKMSALVGSMLLMLFYLGQRTKSRPPSVHH